MRKEEEIREVEEEEGSEKKEGRGGAERWRKKGGVWNGNGNLEWKEKSRIGKKDSRIGRGNLE